MRHETSEQLTHALATVWSLPGRVEGLPYSAGRVEGLPYSPGGVEGLPYSPSRVEGLPYSAEQKETFSSFC